MNLNVSCSLYESVVRTGANVCDSVVRDDYFLCLNLRKFGILYHVLLNYDRCRSGVEYLKKLHNII